MDYSTMTKRQLLDEIAVLGKKVDELSMAGSMFEELVQQSIIGIYILHGGDVIYANPKLGDIFGYSIEDLLSLESLDLLAYDDESRAIISETHSRIEESGTEVFFKFRGKRQDGSFVYLEIYASTLSHEGQSYIFGVVTDVTSRIMAEAETLESNEEYRKLYSLVRNMCDNLPSMIWAKDLDGRYLFANRAKCGDLLMLSDTSDPIGKTDIDLVDRVRGMKPENQNWLTLVEGCQKSDKAVLKAGRALRFEESGLCKNTFTYLDVWKAPLHAEDGELIGTVGSARDITDYRKLLDEVKDSEDRYRTLVESISDLIWECDSDGNFTYINSRSKDIFGYDPAELIGKNVCDVLALSEDSIGCKRRFEEALSQGHQFVNIEVVSLARDGREVYLDINLVPVYDNAGNLLKTRGIGRDITEKMKAKTDKDALEKQLLQAQKTEALGHLAIGIAHDFNNIVSAMLGYGKLLSIKLSDTDPLKRMAKQMINTSEKARTLIQNLLSFDRKENAESVKVIDICDSVIGAGEMLSRILGNRVTIDVAGCRCALNVRILRIEFEQVLINLALNAKNSMPSGGYFSIVAELVNVAGKLEGGRQLPCDGKYAVISVTDSGYGMSKDVADRIFEPFYSHGISSNNSGLGLAIVYNVVTQNKGCIDVLSDPGRGTTFKVYLPISEVPEDSGVGISETIIMGRGEKVLLAEDDEDLREIHGSFLSNYGYTVIPACDGDEAVTKYFENPDIAVLLLDVVMPKKNASEVLQEIMKVDPLVKVVLCSGHKERSFAGLNVPQGSLYVEKPVSPFDLLAKIRKVLDSNLVGKEN